MNTPEAASAAILPERLERMIIEERLSQLPKIPVKTGQHQSFEQGACVMELAGWVSGEPWSDHPQCACPVITSFMISWNDGLPSDADRDRLLKPLIPVVVGTRSTPSVAERRSYMALDWLIRVHTPRWLDLTPALREHAAALRDLDAIVDMAGATAASKKVRAAEDAARAATWAAAGSAAGSAARAAAWAAAGNAARAALKPTTEWLQASAQHLVRDMAAVREVA